jgi:ribosomal protein S18 acetylase RimI-like enzyme
VIDGERLIGMLDADIHRNSQRSHCTSFGMSVLNEYRRHGVGSALLKELFLWAKEHQLNRIELEVFSNNLAAIGLYKKMGFWVEGVKKEAVRVGAGYVDLVQMVRLVA